MEELLANSLAENELDSSVIDIIDGIYVGIYGGRGGIYGEDGIYGAGEDSLKAGLQRASSHCINDC